MRRLALVVITPEAMIDMFAEGNTIHAKVEKGLPLGANVRNVAVDPVDGMIKVLVEHESFGEVAAGTIPPQYDVVLKTQLS